MLKNIGFYINKVSDDNRNLDIFKTLNSSIRR